MKKGSACAAVLVFSFGVMFLSGCETGKGMAQDTKNTWHHLAGGGTGSAKGAIQKADEWTQKNLW